MKNKEITFGEWCDKTYTLEKKKKVISDKNSDDIFLLPTTSEHKIILRCGRSPKNHPEYERSIKELVRNKTGRCPYCSRKNMPIENTLAYAVPEVYEYWSDRNEKSPKEYAQTSEKKVWFKCENGIHEDYERKISNMRSYGFKCPKCVTRDAAIKNINSMIGQKYGRLTIVGMDIEDYDKNYGKYLGVRVFCQCDCGSPVKSIYLSHVTSGKIISCGCYHSEITSGENNHNWKGGITPEIRAARTSTEYIHFHKAALEKDWYTCQCCGKKSDGTKGNMHVHHILPFNEYKELRFDPSNGMALCFDCHDVKSDVGFHHIYGTHNNTPEQLEEYINNRRKDIGIEGSFKLQDYYDKDSSIQKDSIVISQNN